MQPRHTVIAFHVQDLVFGETAHSEVVRKLSTRSVTAAVTAMVPNSLGPGELLMMFGTDEQRNYWLPRLAEGSEIPCFGLTSPEAGSDAASMIDSGPRSLTTRARSFPSTNSMTRKWTCRSPSA